MQFTIHFIGLGEITLIKMSNKKSDDSRSQYDTHFGKGFSSLSIIVKEEICTQPRVKN